MGFLYFAHCAHCCEHLERFSRFVHCARFARHFARHALHAHRFACNFRFAHHTHFSHSRERFPHSSFNAPPPCEEWRFLDNSVALVRQNAHQSVCKPNATLHSRTRTLRETHHHSAHASRKALHQRACIPSNFVLILQLYSL